MTESKETWTDEKKWGYLVRHERLGEILVRQGKITLLQLEDALIEQAKEESPKHIGEIIVDKSYLTLDQIVEALDEQQRSHKTSEISIQQLKTRNKE